MMHGPQATIKLVKRSFPWKKSAYILFCRC